MRRVVSVLGILALAGTVMAAQAATQKTKAPAQKTKVAAAVTKTAHGAVETFANNTLTVKTAKGSENFVINAETKITKSAKKVEPTALTAGETVNVRYTEAAGVMTATSVTVQAATPTKKAPAAPVKK